MLTVHKFHLEIGKLNTLQIPEEAELLTIQNQRGNICAWFLVNTNNLFEERVFSVFGTGSSLNKVEMDDSVYCATIQQGEFVWHIFEFIG